MVVSFTVVSPPTNSIEVHGTLGSIIENHNWSNPVRIYSLHEEMGEYRRTWYEPEIEHGLFPIYYEISARIEDDYFTNCIIDNEKPDFTPEQARDAIIGILMSYLSAKTKKLATINDLIDLYHTHGTRSILEGLEKAVQDKYCR